MDCVVNICQGIYYMMSDLLFLQTENDNEEELSNSSEEKDSSNENRVVNNKTFKNDSVRSGESKYKVLSFDPGTRDNYETEKCIDFWKFIQSQELKKARGFKIFSSCDSSEYEFVRNVQENLAGNKSSGVQSGSDLEIGWKEAFLLLQKYGLDKIALSAGNVKKKAHACSFDESTFKAASETSTDDGKFFEDLGKWDPEKGKHELISVETATDPILTKDVSTQSEFPTKDEEARAEKALLHNEIDALVARLAEMYSFDEKCLVKTECVLDYSNREWDSRSDLDVDKARNLVDKATCSCGEVSCFCSILGRILRRIGGANEEFKGLSREQVENCECGVLSSRCLRDDEMLLKSLLEVKKSSGSFAGKCSCSCGQLNCPCDILMKLHGDVERIFGKDDGSDCECKESCSCTSLYKQILPSLCSSSKSSLTKPLQYDTEVCPTSIKRGGSSKFQILSSASVSKTSITYTGTKIYVDRLRTEVTYPDFKQETPETPISTSESEVFKVTSDLSSKRDDLIAKHQESLQKCLEEMKNQSDERTSTNPSTISLQTPLTISNYSNQPKNVSQASSTITDIKNYGEKPNSFFEKTSTVQSEVAVSEFAKYLACSIANTKKKVERTKTPGIKKLIDKNLNVQSDLNKNQNKETKFRSVARKSNSTKNSVSFVQIRENSTPSVSTDSQK